MDFTNEQLKTILGKSLLKADHKFEAPPVCLEIGGEYGKQIFATLGNFSTILARPKVGKTTFTAIAISSLLLNKNCLNFIPNLPNGRKKILWIDTEQGKPECVKTIQFISKLNGLPDDKHPRNLDFYSLRGLNNKQMIQLTEFAINYTKDISFVVIDGIRDFVASINDEREATLIANKLLKWTQEKNIHILTILHQNKGDSNARGHLGTELMNKAETVAKLVRDENNGERITIVEPEFTRHKDFEAFSYSIDDVGNLNAAEKTEYEPKNPKVHELTVHQIKNVIETSLNGNSTLPYGKLVQSLKSALTTIDINFGDNKTKSLLTYLQGENYLNYNEKTKQYFSNIP